MNNRLEVLRARMHAEEAKVAKKPKVKVTKSVKLAPVAQEVVGFNPPMSLTDAVTTLSPEEAASPKVVAATVALQLLDQLMRSSRPTTDFFSDRMLEDLTFIQAQVWAEKPNLDQVFARAISIADGIEFRTGGEEGSGIRKLHEIERMLIAQKMGRAQ
jgi:hypothetical protein